MALSPPEMLVVSPRGMSRGFLRRWCICSLAGGAVVSAFDAALIQRRESYFTGGFLSTDHLEGPGDIALFLMVSLLADVAVVGLLAGLAMWACHRLRPRACIAAGFLAGVIPLVGANVVAYELVRYLGDVLDFRLMLDLAGGSLGEMLAVSSAHLVMPIAGATSGAAACGGFVWLVNRRERGDPAGRPRFMTLMIPALVFCAVAGITTGAISANERIENGVLRKPAGKILALVADESTDFDRDGFGIAGRMSDPDPRNALVFPYAVEVPGNGVDEDGVGGDLPVDVLPYVEPTVAAPWVRHPDVVLIVLESFRFDLLGTRYEGRPVTPVMDALAARGLSSQHSYSHNGYTAQSRFHLLSGSLAGVRDGATLIDDFKANGYLTAYVSGQDESFGGARYDVGFARADVAFDARSDRERRYSTFTTAGSLAVPFAVVEEHVIESLQRRVPPGQPLFLYVNFHDTHFPYLHDGVKPLVSNVRLPRNRIVPAERDAVWATYVNTAANVDRAIGDVLEHVRRARGAEPAVIVTSDHGESLFDDGFLGHGHALNEVQTRVPFIVANLPMVIEEPFGHVDLRDAIGEALRAPEALSPTPRLGASPAREVFQYLGNVNRPRQIALRDATGLVVYDFRTQRLQVRGGPSLRTSELSGLDRVEFLRLVHHWERMMLARQSRAVDE